MEHPPLSPRKPPQHVDNSPQKKAEEGGSWFGWVTYLGKTLLGRAAEKGTDEYVEKEGAVLEGSEKKILERGAEKGEKEVEISGAHWSSAHGPEVPDDLFSQAVAADYNERLYKNQEKNWAIIFTKLESIEGFDRKQYEENPVKFFSDLVSSDEMAGIFNKIVLSDEEFGAAWKLITDERTRYFYNLVDDYYSDDVEYQKAREHFKQLLELKASEKAEKGDWSFADEPVLEAELRKEYSEFDRCFNEKLKAYFNSMEAKYYANDLKFQEALKVVQEVKDAVFEATKPRDLIVMADELHEEYQKGAGLEDVESDFKEAVDCINKREVVLKVLFNFEYSEKEVKDKLAIPSLAVDWESIKVQAARDQEFIGKHPGVEFMPELGVVAFVMTSPVSYPTKKVGDVFADHLGRKAIQPNLPEVGKDKGKEDAVVGTKVVPQSLSSAVSTPQQSSSVASTPQPSSTTVSGPQKSKAVSTPQQLMARKQMLDRRREIFDKTWDKMFEEITGKMNGLNYDQIREEHQKEWDEKFKKDEDSNITFDNVFGDLKNKGLSELNEFLNSSEFIVKTRNLKEYGFYEEFPLSKEDKGYKEAAEYVDKNVASLESDIRKERKEMFNKTWDEMFNKIKGEILSGNAYKDIRKRYEKEWVENFKIEFSQVFKEFAEMAAKGSAEKGKDKNSLEKIMDNAEVGLKEKAFREEVKDFVEIAWEKEIQRDRVLRYSLMVVSETRRAEEGRLAQKMMKFLEKVEGDESLKAFYTSNNPLKLRYEKVLMEAKLHDYSQAEIDIALEVRGKFFNAFKKHFGGALDMQAWRVLVSREPMLQKAERLIMQKQYDNICFEFERIELLKKREANGENMSAEEMVLIEKGYLECFKDGMSLLVKSMLPWNPLEGPQSLRAGGENVVINVFSGVKEMGNALASFMRTGRGGKRDVVAEMITEYAQKLDNSIRAFSTEVVAVIQDVPKVDKNSFLVHDYTANAKEGTVSRGIKSLLKWTGMVEEPEAIKSQKWMPWLAKYGTAAVVGAGVAVGGTILSGRTPTMMTIFAGMGAGGFWARYSAQIKAAMISAIPGAIVGTVVVVLTGLSGGVALGVIGCVAVLFGLFGVIAMYHTKIGENTRESIAKFVYSDELAWFNQWHERIETADLGRIEFNRAAAKAEARSGQMAMRAELGQDQRYKNLEDVCRDVGLSGKARDEFLEQVRRRPSVLGEPEQFLDLMKRRPGGMTDGDKKMIAEIIRRYREKSKDILKVGLEGRYENLKNELMNLSNMLPEVITELEGKYGRTLLESDDALKDFLISRGISENVVAEIFKEVRPGEKEAKVTQAINQLVKAVGALGQWGAYIALGEAETKRRAEEAGEIKMKEFERDEAFVRVVLALREIIKKKDMLVDEGEMRQLLVEVGFTKDIVEKLYKVYDEKNLEIKYEGVRARWEIDLTEMESAMENMSDDDILALDIIQEGHENYIKRMKIEETTLLSFEIIRDLMGAGELKPDEELLSDDDIEDIRERYADDAYVLSLLNDAQEQDYDDDIPKKNGIPRDEVLMMRFGLKKVDPGTNRVLKLDELSVKDKDSFKNKKDIFIKNFDKLRIGLKRRKLIKADMDELIRIDKNNYVVKVISGMIPDLKERETRIQTRRMKILNEYAVDARLHPR